MSAFYDLASLVLVPSGYKSGKVYAQKPLTTDGQLAFTRASTATRVNASGLIESVATGVPRLDYLNSTCPKLLLEPQRTNSAQYSEQTDNAYWLKHQITIAANQATAPDGTMSADRLTLTGTEGVIYKALTAGALSFFIKAETLSAGARFYISVDGIGSASWSQNGTLFAVTGGTATAATDYGNGWYRCNYNVTSGTVLNYGLTNATIGNTAFIWGIQNEASAAYATSIIPTLGAAVTRVADAASKTGITSLIGQTEGVIFLDFEISNLSEAGNEKLLFYMENGGTGIRYIVLKNDGDLQYIENNGSTIANIIKTGATVGRYKCAIAYATNDFVFYVNGVHIGTDTSGTPSGFSEFGLQYSNLANAGSQNVNQALLFPTRLTNAQLAELTTI